MKEYVIVFQPRRYEFTESEPARLVYGPAPRDWCENELTNLTRDGGPGGGSYSIREAKVEVTW